MSRKWQSYLDDIHTASEKVIPFTRSNVLIVSLNAEHVLTSLVRDVILKCK